LKWLILARAVHYSTCRQPDITKIKPRLQKYAAPKPPPRD